MPAAPSSHRRLRAAGRRSGREGLPAAASPRIRRSGRVGHAADGGEPIQPAEVRERDVLVGAPRDGGIQQVARGVGTAVLECLGASMQQLVRLALALGLRAPRTIDVRAGPRVAAIEKQDARPDVNGLFVIAGEVSIQTDEQELLDPRVALASFERVSGGSVGRRRDQTSRASARRNAPRRLSAKHRIYRMTQAPTTGLSSAMW